MSQALQGLRISVTVPKTEADSLLAQFQALVEEAGGTIEVKSRSNVAPELTALGIATLTAQQFAGMGINTPEQVLEYSEARLLETPGFGIRNVMQLRVALAKRGKYLMGESATTFADDVVSLGVVSPIQYEKLYAAGLRSIRKLRGMTADEFTDATCMTAYNLRKLHGGTFFKQ